jgi:cysteine desulfurase
MRAPPVYLDHAASTPVRPEVLEAMQPYLGASFGNPSSSHRFGRLARAGLEQARREVAEALGAEPSQVVFTSGGTEADNLAILGTALRARRQGRPMRVVTTAVEHKAVLAAAHAVVGLGGEEVIVPVDAHGVVDLARLDAELSRSPTIVSVIWVNNETGVRQPVEAIARRCRDAGVPLHADGVQAFGNLPISLAECPCSLLSISGHKIGAPKGIGALIVRDKTTIDPLIHGGGQQLGIRPGTENVSGAVALGRAATLAAAEVADKATRLQELRDRLLDGLRAAVPDLQVNGAGAERAAHVLNVSVPGADGEALLMHLDLAGVAVSGGSACATGSVEPSHVLTAMGVPRLLALNAIRFSLGHTSVAADVERAVAAFPGVVAKVRELATVLGRA